MRRTRLIRRRKAIGLSQERLAEELGVDRTTIFRWEHGDTTPQPWQRPNLATALRLSVEELDALLTDRRAAEPQRLFVVPVMVGVEVVGNAADDLETMRSFRLADRQVGGVHLYAALTGYLQRTIAPRIFGVTASDEDADFFSAAAGMTEMAGWMAHDAGHDDLAERHFRRALGLATAGNDTQLRAHVLASLSHLSHHRSRPEQAVAFARHGRRDLAAGGPHPGVHSRLLAMEARGHAALRNPEECSAQLRLAERALDATESEVGSPWVSHFDHAALAAEAARCFRELGHFESAKRYAEQVVALRSTDRPRSRAFAQLMLVSVLIAQGKIDEACDLGRQVVHNTRAVGSYLIVQQLGSLSRVLARHRRNPEASAVLRLLQEDLATRHHLHGLQLPNPEDGRAGIL